jgi:uncharacterized repeat protein (TIGR01451 family)
MAKATVGQRAFHGFRQRLRSGICLGLSVLIGTLGIAAATAPSASAAKPAPVFDQTGSQVHAVIQVETSPAYAGDTVDISSSQLEASCGGMIFFESRQLLNNPPQSIDSIQVVLDDDGNVTVLVKGSPCAAGTDLIEADLVQAPYLTATTTLQVEPPQVTPAGVYASPADEVETGDSENSGNSDVYAVFTVETSPVYAEQPVEISSPELDSRCGQGWEWEPGTGPAINQGSGTTVATGILDDDGNATFDFKAASCAAGTSTVIADVEAGSHPTYVSTFTVTAPQVTLAASVRAAAVRHAAVKNRRHHRRHGGKGSGSGSGTGQGSDPPAITVTADPNPLIETGTPVNTTPVVTPEAILNITKTDTSNDEAECDGDIYYTITVTNTGPVDVNGVVVSDDLNDNPDLDGDSYYSNENGATGATPSGTGNIDDTVDLPAGSTLTYMVDAYTKAELPATGTISNTATLTPPADTNLDPSSNLSATDSGLIYCG